MTKGKVTSIIANLVTVEVDGSVGQNEICHILHEDVRLMSEVIKVIGKTAYIQVFESTRGVRVGSEVEFAGHMLELNLGPGILSRNYDGLQNDLDQLSGIFLKRGEYVFPLDQKQKYTFEPLVKTGDGVHAADWLGTVKENWIDHKIMVPFKFKGSGKITWIAEKGEYTIHDKIAVVENEKGEKEEITMVQKWPIKVAITNYQNKPRPTKLLQTGVRAIDTFNPMTEGGTGFIPGPFGAGKTVLQHAISKNADADLIIITACGERANEVVEIFTEFPELEDPRTGR
ncbi:MAG: V-type ATP synthase subunit A, partial [Cyclobacteriaceae bacterium]